MVVASSASFSAGCYASLSIGESDVVGTNATHIVLYLCFFSAFVVWAVRVIVYSDNG